MPSVTLFGKRRGESISCHRQSFGRTASLSQEAGFMLKGGSRGRINILQWGLWNTFPVVLHVKCHVILPVTACPWGGGVLLLEPIPALSRGEGRVLPGQVTSSLQGPHWWAMWGSVSCSKTLRHAAQPSRRFELVTSRSLVDLLYPLSYSRPTCKMVKQNR